MKRRFYHILNSEVFRNPIRWNKDRLLFKALEGFFFLKDEGIKIELIDLRDHKVWFSSKNEIFWFRNYVYEPPLLGWSPSWSYWVVFIKGLIGSQVEWTLVKNVNIFTNFRKDLELGLASLHPYIFDFSTLPLVAHSEIEFLSFFEFPSSITRVLVFSLSSEFLRLKS